MIYQFVEATSYGLYWTVLAAWRALPIFIVALVLARLLRQRIAARYLALLWILVVARLLIPVSVPSSFAISSLGDKAIGTLTTADQTQELPYAYDTFTYEDESGQSKTIAIPAASQQETQIPQADSPPLSAGNETPKLSVTYGTEVNHIEHTLTERILILVSYLILFVWALGVLFFSLRGVIAHFGFARRLRSRPSIQDQAIIDRLLRACDSIGIGKRPELKEVDGIDSPAVFGCFRPVICLPKNWREELDGDKLDWVLRHELAHIKRKDGFVLIVASIAHAFHWFHPISWVALSKLRCSIEKSADEIAVVGLSPTNVKAYAELLLKYAANRSSQTPALGLLSMAAPRGLAQRIDALSSPVAKPRWFARFTVLLIIAGTGLCGLTDASEQEDASLDSDPKANYQITIPESEWPRLNSVDVPSNEVELPEVRIDVKRALKKVAELKPGIDAEAYIEHYFGHHEPGKSRVENGVLIIRATPATAESVKRSLKAFEVSGPYQIATELKIMVTDVRFLNQYDWTCRNDVTCRRISNSKSPNISENWSAAFPNDSSVGGFADVKSQYEIQQTASTPVWVTKVSQSEVEKLEARCQRDPRTNIMSAPKVTLFNGQSALITDTLQRPFVTDIVVDSEANQGDNVRPKISVFETGFKFLIATELTDDKEINVKGIVTESEITDVRVANMPHSSNTQTNGLVVQVPSFQSDSVAIESELAEGESLLVFSPTPYAQDDDSKRGLGRLLILRMNAIDDSASLDSFVESNQQGTTRSAP